MVLIHRLAKIGTAQVNPRYVLALDQKTQARKTQSNGHMVAWETAEMMEEGRDTRTMKDSSGRSMSSLSIKFSTYC